MTKLATHVAGDPSQHGLAWDKLWQNQVTPWDRSEASPSLIELVRSGRISELLSRHSQAPPVTALVPGCGRGYDVVFLAQYFTDIPLHVTGLDISSTAADAAKQYIVEQGSPSGAEVLHGDFFSPQSEQRWSNRVHLIYDYTFLCALNPIRRPEWASAMAKFLVPGGILIALQRKRSVPLEQISFADKLDPLDNHEGGPPFSLSTKIYDDLLENDFDLLIHEKPGAGFNLELSKHDMIAVYRRK